MTEINIVIPTFNEDKNIIPLLRNIKKNVPTASIAIVDDSKNNIMKQILKKNKFEKSIKYFHRINCKGRGSAVLYGFRQLFKKKNNQIFIEMDADFSHKPSELKKNIRLFKKKNIDLLIASRYLPKSKIINWSLSRKIFSKLSNILAKTMLNVEVKDYTNGFRIYSKKAARLITNKCGKIGDGFIVLSEILLVLDINKFRIHEVSTVFINRKRGESSVNLTLVLQSFFGLIKLFLIKKNYKI